MMKRLLVALAALFFAGQAQAADNYAATPGSGKTFRCLDISTVCFPYFIPSDGSGVILFTNTNAGYVQFVTAPTVNLGTIGLAATAANQASLNTATGTVSDAAYSGTGDGTIIAILKWIGASINGAIQSGTNLIGGTWLVDAAGTIKATVKAASTPSVATDTALVTALRPAIAATPIIVAASDNHQTIKNGAGTAFSVSVTNNSATANYIRLYDAATGFNGCNSATGAIFFMEIPPNNSGFSVSLGGSRGISFTSGLSACVTSGFGLTDTTNATASAIGVNVATN